MSTRIPPAQVGPERFQRMPRSRSERVRAASVGAALPWCRSSSASRCCSSHSAARRAAHVAADPRAADGDDRRGPAAVGPAVGGVAGVAAVHHLRGGRAAQRPVRGRPAGPGAAGRPESARGQDPGGLGPPAGHLRGTGHGARTQGRAEGIGAGTTRSPSRRWRRTSRTRRPRRVGEASRPAEQAAGRADCGAGLLARGRRARPRGGQGPRRQAGLRGPAARRPLPRQLWDIAERTLG